MVFHREVSLLREMLSPLSYPGNSLAPSFAISKEYTMWVMRMRCSFEKQRYTSSVVILPGLVRLFLKVGMWFFFNASWSKLSLCTFSSLFLNNPNIERRHHQEPLPLRVRKVHLLTPHPGCLTLVLALSFMLLISYVVI